MYHFDQLGRVRVEIHHVARLFCRLGTGVHRHRHVGLRQRRGVVGTVAGHRHQTAFRLILANECQLRFRRRFGKEIIHARFGGNGRRSQTVIPGDHHRFNAHLTHLGETLFYTAFNDILQSDHPQNACTFRHHQRGCPLTRHAFHQMVDFRGEVSIIGFNMTANGINGPFTDHPVLNVNAAHAGLRREGNERGVQALYVALAQVKALLGEDHDTAAFRRFIGQRGKLRRVSQRFFIHAGSR